MKDGKRVKYEEPSMEGGIEVYWLEQGEKIQFGENWLHIRTGETSPVFSVPRERVIDVE